MANVSDLPEFSATKVTNFTNRQKKKLELQGPTSMGSLQKKNQRKRQEKGILIEKITKLYQSTFSQL